MGTIISRSFLSFPSQLSYLPQQIYVGRRFTEGDAVQTPFGKGVVREVRNNGRLLVDVHDRSLVIRESEVSALDANPSRTAALHGPPAARSRHARKAALDGPPDKKKFVQPVEVDLHGLTVEDALARVEHALNEALLVDRDVLRLIHGRSGGRIRDALHRRLRELPGVRGFRLDPRNEGVTIVDL